MVLISRLSRWPRIIIGDRVPGVPAETTNILRARALRTIQLKIIGSHGPGRCTLFQ